MELIAHQQEKMEELISYILAGEKRIVLSGSAGTGKTTLVNFFIKVLKTTLYKYGAVYITAPTHKALAVLKTKIDAKDYIVFKTIHSGHELKRQINFKTGQTTFVQINDDPSNRFKNAQVIVVDESSMLEAMMLKYNDQHPEKLFIFLGDPKQLPPVNEKVSPVFTQGYPEVHLEKIVRQGIGSPIIELSNNLNLIKSKISVSNEVGGYIFDNNRDYIVDKLAKVNGTDEVKYLAWTNADVDRMNMDVRIKIYGNPKRVEPGESLVFSAPYRKYQNNEEVKVRSTEIIDYVLRVPTKDTKFSLDKNSGELVINEQFIGGVRQETYISTPIKVYRVGLERIVKTKSSEDDEDEEQPKTALPILVLHETSDILFHKYAIELKAKCKAGEIIWPAYYWFIETFARFQYNHSLTVHRSQGSTYQTAIINIGNIELNRKKNPTETNSMLYTAVTRAAKLVVLYNVR